MLRNLKDLQGYALRAVDGDIGTVKDFLFDDERWVVRHLVVETGHWLASRKVLVAAASLGAPNHDEKVLPVSITREQVKNSPDIDTDKTISRQHERDHLGYYGYPAYWDSVGVWGAGSLAGVEAPQADVVEQQRGDPHLRSCKAVTGYHIKARDGEIGHVQGGIVDEESWAIRYLIVDTSNWWLGHKVLIAPPWIQEVSWVDSTVAVNLSRQAIRDAPAWDSALPPDREQEIDIYKHYDRTGYW